MSRILKAGSVKFDEANTVKIDIPVFTSKKDTPSPADDFTEEIIEEETEAIEEYNAVLEAQQEAQRIIDEAQQKAQNIISKAKNEAQQIVNTARSEGDKIYQESQSSGYEQGYQEGYDALAQLRAEADNVLSDTKIEREKVIAGIEGEMVDIISNIVHKLILCEADINPAIIISLIHMGFAESTIVGDIKIHVSKDDYDLVVSNRDDILAKAAGSTNVEIIKNLSMMKGDCIIETPYGNIDCSLEQQFQALKNNLYFLFENKSG